MTSLFSFLSDTIPSGCTPLTFGVSECCISFMECFLNCQFSPLLVFRSDNFHIEAKKFKVMSHPIQNLIITRSKYGENKSGLTLGIVMSDYVTLIQPFEEKSIERKFLCQFLFSLLILHSFNQINSDIFLILSFRAADSKVTTILSAKITAGISLNLHSSCSSSSFQCF